MVAITVPVYNVLAVLALEVFLQGGKMPVGRVLREIVTNPLIIGCACGLAANLAGLTLPTLLFSPMDSLAFAATPVALIALGGSFHMERVSADRRAILVGVLVKLIFLPLAALSVGAALGFRGVELGTMAITFAAPTSVSSFSMAQQMGADAEMCIRDRAQGAPGGHVPVSGNTLPGGGGLEERLSGHFLTLAPVQDTMGRRRTPTHQKPFAKTEKEN